MRRLVRLFQNCPSNLSGLLLRVKASADLILHRQFAKRVPLDVKAVYIPAKTIPFGFWPSLKNKYKPAPALVQQKSLHTMSL